MLGLGGREGKGREGKGKTSGRAVPTKKGRGKREECATEGVREDAGESRAIGRAEALRQSASPDSVHIMFVV